MEKIESNLVKDNYNMDSAKYDNILDEMLHKDTAKYTTSRKFKFRFYFKSKKHFKFFFYSFFFRV